MCIATIAGTKLVLDLNLVLVSSLVLGSMKSTSILKGRKMAVDTGMVVVIFIIVMYMAIVFGLLFYIKNDWCDLLHSNHTVRGRIKPGAKANLNPMSVDFGFDRDFQENQDCRPRFYSKVGTSSSGGEATGSAL